MSDQNERIPKDDLALALMAAWCNVTVDQLPEEARTHPNDSTRRAWQRVAEAAFGQAAMVARKFHGCLDDRGGPIGIANEIIAASKAGEATEITREVVGWLYERKPGVWPEAPPVITTQRWHEDDPARPYWIETALVRANVP